MKKMFFVSLLVIGSVLGLSSAVYADNNVQRVKGRVKDVSPVECEESYSAEEFKCVEYVVEILGTQEVVTTTQSLYGDENELVAKNAKVYVVQSESLKGDLVWQIDGYSREFTLAVLIMIFVILSFLINGRKGIGATVGLLATILVIYGCTIPMLIQGVSILWVGLVTMALLLFSTFLSHGFNRKSMIAVVSMSLGSLVIFIMGYLSMKALHINGVGEETTTLLAHQLSGELNLFGMFLFSIVLGGIGILDDVAVGQVSSMQELLESNPNLKASQLYSQSMNIGRDHIASMINTLFIAYAGSSLSLVIVLALNNPDFNVLINLDFITEEILRTIIPSIGLILIVPLTSFLASQILTLKKKS